MTAPQGDRGERTELMRRLRQLVSQSMADGFAGEPIEQLRAMVASCEAQVERYSRLGLTDVSHEARGASAAE